MPRDSAETRARLLDEATRLFAEVGIYQTTLREITEAAGQRNASAVSYHFGSRQGLVEELLMRADTPLDRQRGELLAGAGSDPSTRVLVQALVTPMVGCLSDQDGRYFLRIIAQLSGVFAHWRVESPLTGPNVAEVLGRLESRPGPGPPELRRERVVGLIMLLTSVMAERARQIDAGEPLALDETVFEANLVDMLVGVVEAPVDDRAALQSS